MRDSKTTELSLSEERTLLQEKSRRGDLNKTSFQKIYLRPWDVSRNL